MSSGLNLEYSSLESTSKWRNLPPPPGFSKTTSSSKGTSKAVAISSTTPEAYDQLKDKRAWDLAISPAKSLPMQFFMLYMSGSGVQIFSMGIIFMLLSSPFKNIAGMNEAFASFAPSASKNPKSFSTMALQKLAYFACNLLTLASGCGNVVPWAYCQLGPAIGLHSKLGVRHLNFLFYSIYHMYHYRKPNIIPYTRSALLSALWIRHYVETNRYIPFHTVQCSTELKDG